MKRFFNGGWLLGVLIAISIFGFAQAAHAAGNATYYLYWEDGDTNAIKDAIDGDHYRDLQGKLFLVGKDGLWGENGYTLSFSTAVNEQINDHGSLAVDVKDWYFAVAPVYCKDNKLTTDKPSSAPYFHLDYVLGFNFADWSAVEGKDTYPTYGGITRVVKIGGTGQADNEVFVKDEFNKHNLVDDLKSNDNDGGNDKKLTEQGISSTCLNGLPRGDLGQKTKNYHTLPPEEKDAVDRIIAEGGIAIPSGGSGADQAGTNCNGGAMGWLFCPMVNAMASTVRFTAGLIDNLMQVRFLSSKDAAAQLEAAWRAILSLANILLVIAFLFIIFSQATSMGVSNYGIKKILPRLVVAAILMNLSFYICALAIDISNIVGGSIMGFFLGEGNNITTAIKGATGGEGDFISGAIAGAAMIALLFFIFVPVVLSIIAVFVMLIGRQVILMVLVLVSPLAFVAWLLPNTEKHFKKWYELFFQMLVVYPMVMIMFGASLYLANIIGNPDIGTSVIQLKD